jgi:hypothetical protein
LIKTLAVPGEKLQLLDAKFQLKPPRLATLEVKLMLSEG